VKILGVQKDLAAIGASVEEFKPHIVFNLLENFDDVTTFDQNVVSHLELMRLPYTGCNPRGLMLARDKSLSKQLLAYHRIPVPDFLVVKRGRKPVLTKRLKFPLIVKSLFYEASAGISQASVVENAEQLAKRVQFIHDSLGTAAIVERFIDGRELYVGVMGNERVQAFPVWEMTFTNMPENTYRIATERVKWNTRYQQRHGIDTSEAKLPEGLGERIQHIVKRAYRVLDLSGYARLDVRLDSDCRPYVLEANPNPQLAHGEDFAESGERAGLSYDKLLERIVALGLQWQPERTG
jgi:D-alanine-D-alanine ligase